MGLADILNPDKDAQAAAKYLGPILDNLTGELKVMLHEGITQLGAAPGTTYMHPRMHNPAGSVRAALLAFHLTR